MSKSERPFRVLRLLQCCRSWLVSFRRVEIRKAIQGIATFLPGLAGRRTRKRRNQKGHSGYCDLQVAAAAGIVRSEESKSERPFRVLRPFFTSGTALVGPSSSKSERPFRVLRLLLGAPEHDTLERRNQKGHSGYCDFLERARPVFIDSRNQKGHSGYCDFLRDRGGRPQSNPSKSERPFRELRLLAFF